MNDIIAEMGRILRAVPGLRPLSLNEGSKIELRPYRRRLLPSLALPLIPIVLCILLAYAADWVVVDVGLGIVGLLIGFVWTNYLLAFLLGARFVRVRISPQEVFVFDRLSASQVRTRDIKEVTLQKSGWWPMRRWHIVLEADLVTNANMVDILLHRPPRIPAHWLLLDPARDAAALRQAIETVVALGRKELA